MPSADRNRSWSWRVEPTGPAIGKALEVGYALRAAVLEAAAKVGLDRMPEDLHSSGSEGGHRHAYWLSEDRDRDGAIDHVTLFAESGIDPDFARALQATHGFCLDTRHFGLQQAEPGFRREGGLFGPAAVWMAATPFVTRLWRLTKTGKVRADCTPSAQLCREIADLEDFDRRRRLPEPAGIGWLPAIAVGGELKSATDFLLRTEHSQPPGDAVAGFPIVTFAEPVRGPIAIGYGAHFGLGLLIPLDAEP
jgi:CRISPR-associated protein Csb2